MKTRTNCLKIFLLVPATLFGCSAAPPGDAETDETATSAQQPLVLGEGAKAWKNANNKGNVIVPFCWEQPDNPDYEGFASARAESELRLKQTWQAVSGVRFAFQGSCPTSGDELSIRVRQRGYPSNARGGTKVLGMDCLRSATQPGVPANDTMCSAFDYTVAYNPTTKRIETTDSVGRIDYEAVHETGHVLGFAHEMDRSDNTDGCSGADSDAGTWLTSYDHASIMNYCNPDGNSSGRLSPLDIQGARRLYGWHAVTDYNNDGLADLALFRPGTGKWYISSGANGFVWGLQYGASGDVPVAGDFDGDGARDIAVWRPSGTLAGWWFIRNSSGGETRMKYGENGDVPVPGDYDGDGRTDMAVWRPSSGAWYVLATSGQSIPIDLWGEAGDYPVPADYDGDGKTDMAVFRPSGSYAGTWFVMLSSNNWAAGWTLKYGEAGDIPMVGDYDGDAKSDLAVWRPSGDNAGWWFVRLADGSEIRTKHGEPNDVPVAADYNGDGVTDMAVWRPNAGSPDTATWFVKNVYNIQLGSSGDVPVLQPRH